MRSTSRVVAFFLLLAACAPSADPNTPVPSEVPSTPAPPPTPEPEPQPGTGVLLRPVELQDDPVWCWTFIWQFDEDVLTAVGTTTEISVPALTVAPLEYVEDSAVHDDTFVLVGNDMVQRVDLVTGEVLTAEVDFLAVRGITTWNDALITLRNFDELAVYSDFEGLVTGVGSFPAWEVEAAITRFDLDGDLLYGAAHAGGWVHEIDRATGHTLRSIRLDGFNGWFLGLSVEAGVIHVLTHHATGRIIRRFDLDGNPLTSVMVPGNGKALFCDSIPTGDVP